MEAKETMEGDIKQSMDKLVEELRYMVKSDKEIEEIIQILDSIVSASKSSIGEATEFAVDDTFLVLLQHESKDIIARTARAIAEIARCERGREKCTSIQLVKALLDLLKDDRVDVLTQSSRALGNICYENENGKKFVEDKDGLKTILSVLEKSVTLGNIEGASFLRNVAAGLLLNFLIDRPSLHKEAIELNAVKTILGLLQAEAQSEATMHSLLILGILNDTGVNFLNEELTKVLVGTLRSDESTELSEMCLELLHGQAEDEQSKLLLARSGVCELLLSLLEKHGPYCTDEEARSILKVACNLIVLILTGDDSMSLLYDNGNGTVYKTLLSWLSSSDKDLQISAVLAMGNFARSDKHCTTMARQGVHRELLKLVDSGSESDIRFQHAVLSALRNLVIPAENKRLLLNDGLIDSLYPMLSIPTYPIVFKLLGTLRIVIDGQREAAIDLGRREDLIRKAVEWCNIDDHPGVQGEASRLIAWLINNSRDKETALVSINNNSVPPLLKMLCSQHPLMQNEALISLSILSTLCLKELEDCLLKNNVAENLKRFFDKDNTDKHIVENGITFVENIVGSEALRDHLKEQELKSSLVKVGEFQDRVETLISRLYCDEGTRQ